MVEGALLRKDSASSTGSIRKFHVISSEACREELQLSNHLLPSSLSRRYQPQLTTQHVSTSCQSGGAGREICSKERRGPCLEQGRKERSRTLCMLCCWAAAPSNRAIRHAPLSSRILRYDFSCRSFLPSCPAHSVSQDSTSVRSIPFGRRRHHPESLLFLLQSFAEGLQQHQKKQYDYMNSIDRFIQAASLPHQHPKPRSMLLKAACHGKSRAPRAMMLASTSSTSKGSETCMLTGLTHQ